ncbi:MAG TPA: cytochrome d ubiquinol oxidase subunit II [Planctomycetota bacterium]|jgi:cytochrome d ubiquinol oxidase subunit II|nr:cytochrome d ubiquinol oxidase subunit II [Planctomycetota bacterium]
MDTLWFWLLTLMLATYVVLDGYDLGAGIIHLWIARTGTERATIIRAVGQVWDGNEVWLLASGGAIFVAFPLLLATSFSGFYLPMMMLLWLLTGRALGIEFRHQFDQPAWTAVWDVAFSLSSGLLALFLGVALGNVVRGVPIQPDGTFFEPLWASFEPGSTSGVLDGYTVLAGLTAAAALALHGALWVTLKTQGVLQERARRAAKLSAWATGALTFAATLWTRSVQPHMVARFGEYPAGCLLPLVAAVGLGLAIAMRRRKRDLAAFLGSTLFLVFMLLSVAFSLYPYLLPSNTDATRGLTVSTAAAPASSLKTALAWWIPGMLPVLGYFIFVHRKFAGKTDESEHGY